MALVKVKPTSPGRRAVVKVVNPNLYKGRPVDALTEEKKRKAGRNNHGHITTRRHHGGEHTSGDAALGLGARLGHHQGGRHAGGTAQAAGFLDTDVDRAADRRVGDSRLERQAVKLKPSLPL